MPVVDEQHLIAQARAGNRAAYRVLVEEHMRQAYALAYRFVNDHHAAEEVSQEAFVKAYEGLPAFRGEAAFMTWLHRIVTNIALNRLKSAQRKREVPLDLYAGNMVADADGIDDPPTYDVQSQIERALHELPTLQRAVVILRHIHGLSTREVGQILQCSEGTVKTHLFRGLEKMRVKLNHLRGE
jgi:RNA polymerase sigma-70 factor, ECF subfamily